jgi:hypothetical protein
MRALFYLPLTWFYMTVIEQPLLTADILPDELRKLMLDMIQLKSEIINIAVGKVLGPSCETIWFDN